MTLPENGLELLKEFLDSGRAVRYRFFWGHKPRSDGRLSDSAFSQWWPCDFSVDGVRYSTAEQYMMAEKARLFGDGDALLAILDSSNPQTCKSLGRSVRNFDEGEWERHRYGIVVAGNMAKFGQDAALRDHLLSTGNDVLVEASPYDRVWGIGLARDDERAQHPRTWRGLNLLGFALCRVRRLLRSQ